MTITLRNYRGRLCAWIDSGPIGFVVHSLSELHDDGFVPLPGSRGVWVKP